MGLSRLTDARLYEDYAYFCDHFRAYVASLRGSRDERLLYHCFWHGPLTAHHELSLKSLLVTQRGPLEVWLWATPDTIATNRPFLEAMADPCLRVMACEASLLQDTPLQDRADLIRGPGLAAISDLVRTVVLLKYGGLYFDLDLLFLKDLRDLTGVEFIYPWSNQPYGNSAVMHFRRRSPDLAALAARAATMNTCHPRSFLAFDAIEPIVREVHLLPVFVFDPAWVAHDTNRPINDYCLSFGDFFIKERQVPLATFYPGSYGYHWHNGWQLPLTGRSLAGQWYRYVSEQYARRSEPSGVQPLT
jgi:hypothetical protein